MPPRLDLTGERYGRLTCIEDIGNKNGRAFWRCRCKCGKQKKVSSNDLRSGKIKSCGCLCKELGDKKRIDLVGKRFGRLVVKKFVGRNKHRHSLWECVCDCGNTCTVSTMCLRRAKPTKSCGCLQPGITLDENGNIIRLYRIWSGMKQRCFNSNNKDYPRYGAREITVCEEWLEFKCFHDWALANGYKDHLTIERINNDGNYDPSNCTWVPPEAQARNRRSNHFLTFNGKTLIIAEWAEFLQVDRGVIEQRLLRGWNPEEALKKPVKKI